MSASPDRVLGRVSASLTGRFNFKRTLTGKLVLRVEEDVPSRWPWSRGERRKRWRDAGSMDLAAPELRALVDLRTKPQYATPRYFEVPEPAAVPLLDSITLPGEFASKRAPSAGENSWHLHRSSQ